ncbi:MAG TPA: LysR substrate-binding domain-containing protein [Cyanophyceae cyanobacterium]
MNNSSGQSSSSIGYLQRAITLHQLEVFAATNRHASFTRAAEEMALTQPTVSMQVKHLSQVIGMPLLEMIGKRLYATEAGEEVFKTSQAIFERLEQMETVLKELKGIKQGRLSIATSRTAKYIIPRLLPSFHQAYPGIEIALEITAREEVLQRLQNNQDDLYILSYPPEQDDIEIIPFLSNPLVVVAPIDHPLAQEVSIPLKALIDEFWVLREPGSATRVETDRVFQQQRFPGKIRMELNSNEAIKQAIVAGLGISVLSLHSLRSMSWSASLTPLKVEGFPLYQQWYAIFRKDKFFQTTAKLFLKHLIKQSKVECQITSEALIKASGYQQLMPPHPSLSSTEA